MSSNRRCCRRFVNVIKYHRDTGEIIWQQNPICGLDTTDASGDRLKTYSMHRVVYEPVNNLLWVVTNGFKTDPNSLESMRAVALNPDGEHVATCIEKTPGVRRLYDSGPESQNTMHQGGGYPVFQNAADSNYNRINADGTVNASLSYSAGPDREKFVVHSSGDLILSSVETVTPEGRQRRDDWSAVNTFDVLAVNIFDRVISIDGADNVLTVRGTGYYVLDAPDWKTFRSIDGATGSVLAGTFTHTSRMNEAVGLSSGHVVLHRDGRVSLVDATGSLSSSFVDSYTDGNDVDAHLAASDDAIIVGGPDDTDPALRPTVRAYDHSGTLLWRQRWISYGVLRSVAIDGDGHVVAVGAYGLRVADPL